MSEAIVLRRIDYEETSFIISCLSTEGFLSMMVKGAKRKNSMKLGISEPLTLIDFQKSKSIKFPTLIEGTVIKEYRRIKEDLLKYSIGNCVMEYAYSLRESDIDHMRLLNLIKETLDDLESNIDPEITLMRFEVVLLNLVGIMPHKEYIKEEYGGEVVMNEFLKLTGGEQNVNKEELRKFFKRYYEREMNMVLKSKRLYESFI